MVCLQTPPIQALRLSNYAIYIQEVVNIDKMLMLLDGPPLRSSDMTIRYHIQ